MNKTIVKDAASLFSQFDIGDVVWRNRGDEEPLVMAGQFLEKAFLGCAGFEKRKE